MKKRVYIVSPTESVLTRRGDRHPKLAASLVESGYDVCYISTDFYHAEKRFFTLQEMKEVAQRTPYRLKFFHVCGYGDNVSIGRLWGYVVLGWKVLFYLFAHVHRGDVLLVPCRPPEVMLAARWVKALKRCSLILDVRDVWPDGLPLRKRNPFHRLFSFYCRVLNRMSAGGADFAFYTANGFRDWLFQYLPEEKTVFVPLGYDAERWQSSRCLEASDFADNVIKLVFVGDLAKSMDIACLLQTVATNPRYSLTFIGGGEFLERTKALASELYANNIQFLGRFTQEQVVDAMREYHVSVVPLRVKFSMPNKLFDALGARRPLLVFGENDAADFVEENRIGWRLPFEVDTTSSWLASLTKDAVIAASEQIGSIRDIYAKENLYNKIADEIKRLFFLSPKSSRS